MKIIFSIVDIIAAFVCFLVAYALMGAWIPWVRIVGPIAMMGCAIAMTAEAIVIWFWKG